MPRLKPAGPFKSAPRKQNRTWKVFPSRPFALLFAICIFMTASLCIADPILAEDRDPSGAPRQVTVPAPPAEALFKAGVLKSDADAMPAPEQIFSNYTNAVPQKKAYLRAGAEIVLFYGIAEAYYQATVSDPTSYEYKTYEDSLRARFITGDAYRLDLNSWSTNVAHVADGTSFYLLSRTNNLSLPESFLINTGASTAWEMFGEYRDEFSINDAVMTPFGGFATGEVIYQLGEFFQHSSDTIPNRALGYLFGPSVAFHRWLDNTQPKAPANVDKFGFTTDAWHRFRVFAGGGVSDSGNSGGQRAEAEAGFDFEVVTAEKYGKPGEVCLFYVEGVFNDLSFKAAQADNEMVDMRFFAKTAFLGRYQQNIIKDQASRGLEGYSLFMGLSSAFEYYAHDFSGMRREDTLAICDLVGPTLIADYYHQGFHVRASADVFPTFSMVHPAAGGLYDQNHDTTGVRGIYRAHGYYYALGMGTAGKVELDYGPFGLEGQVRYHLFDSIDGLDRVQDRATNDIPFDDERLSLRVALYYKLPIDNLKLALDVERIYRWSNIADFSWDIDETRYLGKVVFEF
ncbi:MAG: DUF3943 domain-containing protein [Syntrophobacteraceae bacterium]